MGTDGYNPKFPTRPVPLSRQAELLAEIETRSWEIYDLRSRYGVANGSPEAAKIWDIDVALPEAVDTLRLLERIARHVGDDDVKSKLSAWLARLEQKEGKAA